MNFGHKQDICFKSHQAGQRQIMKGRRIQNEMCNPVVRSFTGSRKVSLIQQIGYL